MALGMAHLNRGGWVCQV